jgi:hypothetical protein
VRFVPTTLLLWLAPAASALAARGAGGSNRDNGEGYAGETTDKVVTFFSLGVLIFFVLVVTLGTIVQSLLEKRKQQRKATHFQRYGW